LTSGQVVFGAECRRRHAIDRRATAADGTSAARTAIASTRACWWLA
jgi:hypothetical protein